MKEVESALAKAWWIIALFVSYYGYSLHYFDLTIAGNVWGERNDYRGLASQLFLLRRSPCARMNPNWPSIIG